MDRSRWTAVSKKQKWYDKNSCVMCGAASPLPHMIINSTEDGRQVALLCSTHTLYEFIDDDRFLISFTYDPHPVRIGGKPTLY